MSDNEEAPVQEHAEAEVEESTAEGKATTSGEEAKPAVVSRTVKAGTAPLVGKKFKTKFPLGRIKKIMQLDDDVGKVASAAPACISKVLELFLQHLVEQSLDAARDRGAATITASHLKVAIMNEPQFDFLIDLVKDLPDPAHVTEAEKEKKKRAPRKPAAPVLGEDGQPVPKAPRKRAPKKDGGAPAAKRPKTKKKAKTMDSDEEIGDSDDEAPASKSKGEEEEEEEEEEDNADVPVANFQAPVTAAKVVVDDDYDD